MFKTGVIDKVEYINGWLFLDIRDPNTNLLVASFSQMPVDRAKDYYVGRKVHVSIEPVEELSP